MWNLHQAVAALVIGTELPHLLHLPRGSWWGKENKLALVFSLYRGHFLSLCCWRLHWYSNITEIISGLLTFRQKQDTPEWKRGKRGTRACPPNITKGQPDVITGRCATQKGAGYTQSKQTAPFWLGHHTVPGFPVSALINVYLQHTYYLHCSLNSINHYVKY